MNCRTLPLIASLLASCADSSKSPAGVEVAGCPVGGQFREGNPNYEFLPTNWTPFGADFVTFHVDTDSFSSVAAISPRLIVADAANSAAEWSGVSGFSIMVFPSDTAKRLVFDGENALFMDPGKKPWSLPPSQPVGSTLCFAGGLPECEGSGWGERNTECDVVIWRQQNGATLLAPLVTTQFDVDPNLLANPLPTEMDMTTVLVHEFGHVMGLGHAPFISNSIMFPSGTLGSTYVALQAIDQRAATFLYGR